MISFFEPKFVNRSRELSRLREFCSTSRALPLYIFGPEGCGKTRLLREFTRNFTNYFSGDSIALYIDALERESIERALITSSPVKITANIIHSLISKFVDIEVGKCLANNISTLLEKAIGKKRLRDKYVLVVVDDITRSIGLDKIEWYVKWLYELRWKLEEEYKPKSINFIATTSEGLSLDIISKHRHAHPLLIWNLNRESFKELFQELKPPNQIDFQEIWRLLGGNPGKLVELARQFKWNIEEMTKLYEKKIRRIIDKILREKLNNELQIALEDIDGLEKVKTKKMEKLINILIDSNLIIYKYWPTLHGIDIAENSELNIGKYYSWQVPMYREITQKLLQEHES